MNCSGSQDCTVATYKCVLPILKKVLPKQLSVLFDIIARFAKHMQYSSVLIELQVQFVHIFELIYSDNIAFLAPTVKLV